MLTEILIKPFIEDLERQGIEDTTPYEQGFMAGMAALSDILSENIDNQPQLFTYLGMAVSEGMQWVESQVSESPEKSKPIEFVAPRYHAGSEIDNLMPRERQLTPSNGQMTKGQKMAKGIIGLLVSNFAYFDRVDDEGFTVEDFRNFFKSKEFTIDMCTDFFRQALTEATKDLS